MERRGMAAYTVLFPVSFLRPCGHIEAALSTYLHYFLSLHLKALRKPYNAFSCLSDYDMRKAGDKPISALSPASFHTKFISDT